jgi:hypothetical protein
MSGRHSLNAPGEWYVDRRCTDCSAARTVAPGLIVDKDGQSVFARQPKTKSEVMMAWRARLLCPTASVRMETPSDTPGDVFPEKMTEDVYRLGYNAASSYGAHSFLIRRKSGNAMVDAPRFARAVTSTLDEWGGLGDKLLTHRDDIADAERYAKHFGARVWIHKADRMAARFATNILEGVAPTEIGDGLLAMSGSRPHQGERRLSLRPALPRHRGFSRLGLRRRRPGRLQGLLLAFLARASEIPAPAAGISLRVGIRRPWRQHGASSGGDARPLGGSNSSFEEK